MEPVSLSIMAAAAGKALDAPLSDSANRLVPSIIGGVIGNRADGLVCQATKASWTFFRNLRTTGPAFNHDIERGTREAYLLATLELLHQAEARVQGTGSTLLRAGDADVLASLRQGAEADLRDVGNRLPEPVPDAHLFLVDPALAPTSPATSRDGCQGARCHRWWPRFWNRAGRSTRRSGSWCLATGIHSSRSPSW